jgi:hypothetical protein
MLKGKRKYILLLFSFLLIAGYLSLNQIAKHTGYESGIDLATSIGGNYSQSFSANAKQIQIIMSDDDFDKISKLRLRSLERGTIVNEADSYVPIIIIHDGDSLHGEARLKGHMTDHLKGVKWSYRVKLSGDDKLFGVKRFSLQHPGTRNYTFEWVFHEMLKREDIIALHYDFIDVKLNGNQLGIYAFEEHFAQELLVKNERPKGTILRFNPNLYWVGRENSDLLKLRVNEEFSKYQTSVLEPYDRKRVKGDSVLLNNFLRAQETLESFRVGETSTSDVFDVKKLATYHAIIDLVGGHHSLDWSDIKYYLNSESGKIEPVGYESFGVRPIRNLAGNYKYKDNKVDQADFHTLLFSDEKFFKEYIKQVNRLSKKSYLDELITSIKPELDEKLAIIYGEFPYKNFDTEGYLKNQEIMAKCIDVPKAFHAYVHSNTDDTLKLQIGNISTLPAEILEISIGSENQDWNFILPSKKIRQLVDYKLYVIPLKKSLAAKLKDSASIKIKWKLLGGDVKKETKVFSHPNLYLKKKLMSSENNDYSPFAIEVNDSAVVFKPGNHTISDTVYIKAKDINISSSTKLTINKGGVLILDGKVKILGTEEEPVEIDGFGGQLSMVGNHQSHIKELILNKVSIQIQNQSVKIFDCQFKGQSNPALVGNQASIWLYRSLFEEITSDALVMDDSKLISNSNSFYKIEGSAITSKGYSTESKNDRMTHVDSCAFNILQGGLEASNTYIGYQTSTIISRNEGTVVQLKDCDAISTLLTEEVSKICIDCKGL